MGKFEAIGGDNFTGRTNFLKNNLNNYEQGKALYIGEIPTNYISGIAHNVNAELDLHTLNPKGNTANYLNKIIKQLGFDKHFMKNPFVLSGGEQSLLAVLSGLLLEPKFLAIDTTLEQLNEEWRIPFTNAFLNDSFINTPVKLVDNRLKEYGLPYITLEDEVMNYKYIFQKPNINFEIPEGKIAENLNLENIYYSYNSKNEILSGLHCFLEPGKIYHLKGINGAGKTTLSKLLCGVLKLQQGSIYNGNKKQNAYRFPGQLVGYSFQNPDEQLFNQTVENEVLNICKNELPYLTSRREAILNLFGLQSVRHCHPSDLPFVMRKRISLAATIAYDRSWYIFDEPTIGQDDYFIDFFIYLLQGLANQGKGIILITHSISLITRLKMNTLNLNGGKFI